MPEELYDEDERYDSPISAADRLSRAARQKRREIERRSSLSRFARPSSISTPNKSTKRLFPDTPEVQKLGLTPTSRNHSQSRKSKRVRRSQYDDDYEEEEEEREGLDDTTIPYRNRFNAPIASTPYLAQRKQPISNRASMVSERGGPSRRISAGSILRDKSQTHMEEPPSSSSRYLYNTSSSSQKTGKPGWFAGWGTGKEESPMDILRKLAAAPGSLLSTPSSVLERLWGDSQSGKRQTNVHSANDEKSQQVAESSSIGLTPSDSSRNQRSSMNLQNRRSMANTSAAISELGQARRLDPRQSRISTNLFANLDSELNDVTVPGKSFVTHLPDLQEREIELQRILAERTPADEFTLPNRKRQSVNMFDDLLEEEDESLAFEEVDEAATPAPDNFNHGEMQYEDIPYEEESVPLPRQRDSESVPDLDPESGQEESVEEEKVPMRIPRGGYEELYNLDSDSDSEEYLVSSSEGDSASDGDTYRVSRRNRSRTKAISRTSLAKKKSVKTKKVERISRLTNKSVQSMRSTLVRELFRKMVTPNVSVGAIPGPSKPNNPKSKQKRVALDEQVFKTVEDITHEFFVSLAGSLKRHEYRDDSGRYITADVMVDLMKEQGILDSQKSLVSLARKMMPRELSDQLAPNLDNESDEDSEGGKYGMGNISAAVFNEEDFSSSVSGLSQSGSEESESETDYGEMGNVDGKGDRSGAVELLTYRRPASKGRSRSSELTGARGQSNRLREPSSLLSRNSTPRSRQATSSRRRSSTIRR